MNEMFLLKLGEIVLKGGNRFQFENRLKTNVARRMRPFGDFRVSIVQSTAYVEPENADCVGGLPCYLRRGEPVPLPPVRQGSRRHF